MNQGARVTSIEVLQTLAGALQRFRGESAVALDELDIEVRRALEWIHHDRKEYWAHELRRGGENVSHARLQLQQARLSRRIAGHEPSCVDEQRALERAKRHVETAQQKVEAVKHWAYAIDRAVDAFLRSRTQFINWRDTDLQQAVSALNRMSGSLESYVSLEAPVDTHAPILAALDTSAEGCAAAETTPSREAAVLPPSIRRTSRRRRTSREELGCPWRAPQKSNWR